MDPDQTRDLLRKFEVVSEVTRQPGGVLVLESESQRLELEIEMLRGQNGRIREDWVQC